MISFNKRTFLFIPLALFLNGCGIAGLGTAVSKVGTVAKLGVMANVGTKAFIILGPLIVIIIIGIGLFFIATEQNKKYKNKQETNSKTPSPLKPLEQKKDGSKKILSWDETPKTQEKKAQHQEKKVGEKLGFWLAKNLENFKNPTSLKTKANNEKKVEEIKREDANKKLTWDEPLKKSEETKEAPILKQSIDENQKLKEVTITPQEEEVIYSQIAKELSNNRNEGVWLKAYTENDGDETKTKIAYTKKRVNLLIEELKIKKQT